LPVWPKAEEEFSMAKDTHIYGEVKSKTGLEGIFRAIRRDVDAAKSRPALTELYKRAGYLITLTHPPTWEEKFGRQSGSLRRVAEAEFGATARKINRRAGAVGCAGYPVHPPAYSANIGVFSTQPVVPAYLRAHVFVVEPPTHSTRIVMFTIRLSSK
jgi:hypothetical protein